MKTNKRNVVFIVLDTLRADHLSCYGYFRKTDPRISEIAAAGSVFSDFFASGIATGPGFTSIVTGLPPIRNGYYITPWNKPNAEQLDDNIPTMAEIFQHNGYQTAAVDNLVNFRSHMKHFVRGYEYYMNATGSPYWVHHHVTAEKINAMVLPWLADRAEPPFFLFLHYWDPHMPYNQPAEYRRLWRHEPGSTNDLQVRRADAGYDYVPGWGRLGDIEENEKVIEVEGETFRRSMDLYDGEVSYADAAVGRVHDLLKNKDLLEDTILVITADHGEQLGQHGLWGHDGLHDAVIHIPLIIRAPGQLPAGKVVEGFAQHADLLPTVMELAGIDDIPDFDGNAVVKSMDEFEGKPLSRLAAGETFREKIFAESNNSRAVRDRQWKFICRMDAQQTEFYHVAADPMECENLAGQGLNEEKQMKEALFSWMDLSLKGKTDPMRPRTPDHQEREYRDL